jgi:hypothetical protein
MSEQSGQRSREESFELCVDVTIDAVPLLKELLRRGAETIGPDVAETQLVDEGAALNFARARRKKERWCRKIDQMEKSTR